MKRQTAKEYVLERYNEASYYVNLDGCWVVKITESLKVTGATSELAWQNAKAKIEEMEKEK